MLEYKVTYRVKDYPQTIKVFPGVVKGFTEKSCNQKAWHRVKKIATSKVIKIDLIQLMDEEE